jgi:hypothetical protein
MLKMRTAIAIETKKIVWLLFHHSNYCRDPSGITPQATGRAKQSGIKKPCWLDRDGKIKSEENLQKVGTKTDGLLRLDDRYQ